MQKILGSSKISLGIGRAETVAFTLEYHGMKDDSDRELWSHKDLPSLLVTQQAGLTYGNKCFQP